MLIYNLIFFNITLWLFNIAMEAMAHRNRWFTVFNSMVHLSMANCECHNQRVYLLTSLFYLIKPL
jgi:hypothetical protein